MLICHRRYTPEEHARHPLLASNLCGCSALAEKWVASKNNHISPKLKQPKTPM